MIEELTFQRAEETFDAGRCPSNSPARHAGGHARLSEELLIRGAGILGGFKWSDGRAWPAGCAVGGPSSVPAGVVRRQPRGHGPADHGA